jgi:hypothetical protein
MTTKAMSVLTQSLNNPTAVQSNWRPNTSEFLTRPVRIVILM